MRSYKNDLVDHVWTEVLIDGVWVHFDPMENVINDPTFYERVQGKEIIYCFAVSNKYGVEDVTKKLSIGSNFDSSIRKNGRL